MLHSGTLRVGVFASCLFGEALVGVLIGVLVSCSCSCFRVVFGIRCKTECHVSILSKQKVPHVNNALDLMILLCYPT